MTGEPLKAPSPPRPMAYCFIFQDLAKEPGMLARLAPEFIYGGGLCVPGRQEGGERISVERERNPANSTFLAPQVHGGGGHGVSFPRSSRLDICVGSTGGHPPPANQPLENAPLFQLPEPLPAAPLPGTLFKFLPSLCPPCHPGPDRWVGRGRSSLLFLISGARDPVAGGKRREAKVCFLGW